MQDLVISENIKIEDLIYEIRGHQVMLDSDLAKLYKCTNGTKDVNKSVNRNIERFPKDFYFQLTKEEYDNLKFQNGTSKFNNHGGVRKLPYVFTEQGVAMLASVLKTNVASLVSVDIMRAFIVMKKYISKTLLDQTYINDLVLKDSKRIDLLEKTLSKFKEKSNHLFFEGQIFDAYSKINEIFSNAKKELMIIDAYADYTILDIIKRLNIKVIIITKKDNLLSKQDILKYNKQYNNLKVIYNNNFHDRYFILDNSTVYHCGTSINRIGYKTFSITLISDNEVCDMLMSRINDKILHPNK